MINRCGHFYGNNILPYQRLNVYYESAQNCRFVPRCILCDLEPSQIYALRGSAIGHLFNPDYFVTGSQGAGNNWAKGYYTEGAELMDSILEITRKQAENCDCLQGFQMVHSIGGGTGSGMGSLYVNRLCDEYQDRIINTFTVIPSEKVSETVVEPYNAVLSLSELIYNTDETITFDNEALFHIGLKTLKLEHPKFDHLNQLISMIMAGVTTCFRYPGQLNTDLRKLMTNMCPFPRLKFFIPGYAPLLSPFNNTEFQNVTIKSLVCQLFDPNYQMAAYDTQCGKYLTCAAIFRGLVSTRDIEEAMVEVQASKRDIFAKWIPNNIKTAICDIPPNGLTSSATFLANTTSITVIFKRLLCQFDSMFDKRAFIHLYTGEGMDEMEFLEAKETIIQLCNEYVEANNDGDNGDDVFPEPLEHDYSDDGCTLCSECVDPKCKCECVNKWEEKNAC